MTDKRIESSIMLVILVVLLAVVLIRSEPSNQELVVVGAGVFLLIFFAKPEKSLLVYLIISPMLDQMTPFLTQRSAILGRFGPNILLRGGLVVLLAFYLLANSKNRSGVKATLPIFIFLFLIAVNTLASGARLVFGFKMLTKFAFWMLLLLVVADMVAQGKLKLETIYLCLMASASLILASLLISRFFPHEMVYFRGHGGFRFQGFFTMHSMSACLAIGLVIVVASATTQRNIFPMLLLSLLGAAMVISILEGYSRTGYTTATSGFLMVGLMLRIHGKGKVARRQRIIWGTVFIIITGFIVIFASTNVELLKDRLFGDFTDVERVGSGRLIIYSAVLKYYDGYSALSKIFGQGVTASYSFMPERYSRATHSDLLATLLAGGLVGICLYLWILISFWKQTKPTDQDRYWPCIVGRSVLVMYLVNSMTSLPMGDVSMMAYFSFVVGGTIGYYKRIRKEKMGKSDADEESQLNRIMVGEKSAPLTLGRKF